MKKLILGLILLLFFIPSLCLSDAGFVGLKSVDGVVDGGVSCTGTVGNEAAFSGFYTPVAGDIIIRKITISDCSTPATFDMTATLRYISLESREAIFVIYSDSGGEPDTLQYETAPYWNGATTSLIETTLSMSPGVLPAGDYWIGVQLESISSRFYHSVEIVTVKVLPGTFGTVPASWSPGSDTDITDNIMTYLDFGL